jgi:hypothetical protein
VWWVDATFRAGCTVGVGWRRRSGARIRHPIGSRPGSPRRVFAPALRILRYHRRVVRAGVWSARPRPGRTPAPDRHGRASVDENEQEHQPRGALLLILIYLLIIVIFWLNTYLRIWRS